MVPVSIATQDDLELRDLHVAKVIEDYELDVEVYFDLASEYILRVLEFDWWKNYCQSRGINLTKNDSNGNTVTNFDPLKLIKHHPSLMDAHCFYTLHLIYRAVATQLVSTYETAQRNESYWLKTFETHYSRLESVSDFYDVDEDGVSDWNEQKRSAYDTQRYGNRYIR